MEDLKYKSHRSFSAKATLEKRLQLSLIIAWCWSTINDDMQTHSSLYRLLSSAMDMLSLLPQLPKGLYNRGTCNIPLIKSYLGDFQM